MFTFEWKEPSAVKRGRGRGDGKYRQHFEETAKMLADAFDRGEEKSALKLSVPKGDFDGEAAYTRGDNAGRKKTSEELVRQRHANFASRVRTALNRLNRRRERENKARLGLGAKSLGDYDLELVAKEFTTRRRKRDMEAAKTGGNWEA
jgi:hypothetical protein